MSAKPLSLRGNFAYKAPQNIPTAQTPLFTLSGGAVLVTGLLGLITTAIGATVSSLSVGTTGNATAICAATAITSKPAGTWVVPVASAGAGGTPLLLADAAFLTLQGDMTDAPFVLAGGQNITWSMSAADAGQMSWYCWYVPLDPDSGLS